MWWNSLPHAPRNVDEEIWRAGWNLGCPPRLLAFLWRLLDNNIPVRVNLGKRGLVEDTACPLCNTQPESVEHLFISCQETKKLLRTLGYDASLPNLPSFALAWKEYILNSSREEAAKMLAVLWGVWKAQNLCVFEEPDQDALPIVLAKAIRVQAEFATLEERHVQQVPKQQVRWTPPPIGFIKVNTDAGLSNDEGGQVGAVARNDSGEFIQAAIKQVPGIKHPTLLEAHGIILGIELAKELRCQQVIIESDCQPLVLALQTRLKDRSDLAILVDDCLELSDTFDEVSFNFVRRTANEAAHLLAKMQGQFLDVTHFFAIPPETIVETLQKDVSVAI